MRKRLLLSIGVALMGTLLISEALAGKVIYPEEWGENVAADTAGGKVIKTSSYQDSSLKLIDGRDGEDNHWEPEWERGNPWFFLLKLSKRINVGVIQFSTRSNLGDGGVPRTLEIWAAKFRYDEMKMIHKAALENERIQVLKIDKPIPARYLKVVVLSDYGKKGGEIGEVGVFAASRNPPGVFRGTKKHDILELRNGDVLAGSMLNEKIQIQTSYAKPSFAKQQLASLLLEGDMSNIEKVILGNGDVFSGFILNDSISFALNTGPTIEVRREKIKRLGIQIHSRYKSKYSRYDRFVLKNGDTFKGIVTTPKITVVTSYATVPVESKDIALIEFIGKDRGATKITLRNQNLLKGILQEEGIRIDLDSGPEIRIYRDKIHKIIFQK